MDRIRSGIRLTKSFTVTWINVVQAGHRRHGEGAKGSRIVHKSRLAITKMSNRVIKHRNIGK